jgi:hypothetical protein
MRACCDRAVVLLHLVLSALTRQAYGKMVDTPAAVIVAGVGSMMGLLAGVPCWCQMPHLSYSTNADKDADIVEDRKAHFTRILVKLSRVSPA